MRNNHAGSTIRRAGKFNICNSKSQIDITTSHKIQSGHFYFNIVIFFGKINHCRYFLFVEAHIQRRRNKLVLNIILTVNRGDYTSLILVYRSVHTEQIYVKLFPVTADYPGTYP